MTARIMRILIEQTGLREQDVRRIVLTAPDRYKVYTIEKRSGGRRVIAQPSRELKFLQNALMDSVLVHLPVHPAATAYRKGLSTLDNAKPHAQSGPILKMDFREFFPSIRGGAWRRYCEEKAILDYPEDIAISERILFYRPKGSRVLRLSIGAPSSPMLSNLLLNDFDNLVSEAVSVDKVTYTRYADDMTFSAPRTGHLVNVKRTVARIVRKLPYPNLDINDDKTTYITKKYHRTVTGLTLSNDGRITIGRDNKREIRAGVNNAIWGTLSDQDMKTLAGRIAYAISVEPSFVDDIRNRYGADTIKFICQYGSSLNQIPTRL